MFHTVLILAVLGAVQAHAGLVFTLDLPNQTTSPGSVIAFSGSLLNDGGDILFLNSVLSSSGSPDLTIDDSVFFGSLPTSLAPGDSYFGPFFNLITGLSAIPDTYFGSFTIQGGIDAFARDDLATESFGVTVAEVPEPASGLLFVCAGLALLTRTICRIRSLVHWHL